MRQAGRALPEYRKLRQKYSFKQLIKTPELAAEVTLQPVRRFGFDAAILFSDILVVPEALGQSYRLLDPGGVVMEFAIRTKADVERLDADSVLERLGYVAETLQVVRNELGTQTALIGFAGSPWTLATYMIGGGSAEGFGRAIALFREDRKTYFALAAKLTAAVTEYLRMQIQYGVDALQIFDTHGGLLAPAEFWEASACWIQQIISAMQKPATTLPPANKPAEAAVLSQPGQGAVPVIVFALGTAHHWADLVNTGANVLSIDWRFPLEKAREVVPETIAIQGNLTPALLSNGKPEAVAAETRRLLTIMRGRNGYIFNLGHGLPPDARLENITALVDTIQRFNDQTCQ